MGQSLCKIYIHAVFATKFKQPYIDEDIEAALHGYIAGILKKMECRPIKINSMPDHIHILFVMSKIHSISKIMEIIKKDSSKWMKAKGCQEFKWQIGYGAFSVSHYNVQKVINYIANQKKHHGAISLEDEVDQFMKKNDMDQYSKDLFWK